MNRLVLSVSAALLPIAMMTSASAELNFGTTKKIAKAEAVNDGDMIAIAESNGIGTASAVVLQVGNADLLTFGGTSEIRDVSAVNRGLIKAEATSKAGMATALACQICNR